MIGTGTADGHVVPVERAGIQCEAAVAVAGTDDGLVDPPLQSGARGMVGARVVQAELRRHLRHAAVEHHERDQPGDHDQQEDGRHQRESALSFQLFHVMSR